MKCIFFCDLFKKRKYFGVVACAYVLVDRFEDVWNCISSIWTK